MKTLLILAVLAVSCSDESSDEQITTISESLDAQKEKDKDKKKTAPSDELQEVETISTPTIKDESVDSSTAVPIGAAPADANQPVTDIVARDDESMKGPGENPNSDTVVTAPKAAHITSVQDCYHDERIQEFDAFRFKVKTTFYSDSTSKSVVKFWRRSPSYIIYIDEKPYESTVSTSGEIKISIPIKPEHRLSWGESSLIPYTFDLKIFANSVKTAEFYGASDSVRTGPKIPTSESFVCRYTNSVN